MRFLPSTRAVRSLLVAFALMLSCAASFGQVRIFVNFAPPALPVYEQPLCPEDGYLWVPGYWAFADDDYYWVPGTWVLPPESGLLWTPPYWAWEGDRYGFYNGYWGPTVGFYGGIAYGFGYFGEGYEGGRWDHDRFFYNREVNNVNVTNIHNVYNQTVINNTTINRVSYNGGNGGVAARPRPQDEAAAHERHIPPVAAQTQHIEAARSNRELRASANQGKPPVAATPKPGAFRDREVKPAREAGAPYNPPAQRVAAQGQDRAPAGNANNNPRSDNNNSRPNNGIHPKDMPPHPRPEAPDTGNSKQDMKYQQQQEKMYAKQEQDHQKLQQKQDQDHQRMQKQNADQVRNQQLEQHHQQQTKQMEQRHAEQMQKMQQRLPNNRNQPQRQDEKR